MTPPWAGGSWQPAYVGTPPGPGWGVALGFRFGISNDKILQFVASFIK